jgi:hypothetical protein
MVEVSCLAGGVGQSSMSFAVDVSMMMGEWANSSRGEGASKLSYWEPNVTTKILFIGGFLSWIMYTF